VCIVMEYCDRGCLRDLMEEEGFTAFTPKQLLDAFFQVCLGLEATHDMGIVHTDIKLENIMVRLLPGGQYQLKIGDYGLAVFKGDNSQKTDTQQPVKANGGFLRVASQINPAPPKTASRRASRKGSRRPVNHFSHQKVTEAVGGTPAYIAPEVFEVFDHFSEEPMKVAEYNSVVESRHSVVSFPVDIWALAFVLYELTGLEIADEEPYPGQLALDKDSWPVERDQLARRLRNIILGIEESEGEGEGEAGTPPEPNSEPNSEPTEPKPEAKKPQPRSKSLVDRNVHVDRDGASTPPKPSKSSFPIINRKLVSPFGDEKRMSSDDAKNPTLPLSSDQWISIELVQIFRKMLHRHPNERITIQDILRSPVFMVLPSSNRGSSNGDMLQRDSGGSRTPSRHHTNADIHNNASHYSAGQLRLRRTQSDVRCT